jgi:hypothetical protein
LLESTPLHGPYQPVSRSRSPIAADLLERLPPSIGRSGLADWVTDSIGTGTGTRGAGALGFASEKKNSRIRDGSNGGLRGDGNGHGDYERVKGKIGSRVKHYGGKVGDTTPWRLRDRERARIEGAWDAMKTGEPNETKDAISVLQRTARTGKLPETTKKVTEDGQSMERETPTQARPMTSELVPTKVDQDGGYDTAVTKKQQYNTPEDLDFTKAPIPAQGMMKGLGGARYGALAKK